MALPFIAPSRAGIDWFPAGLASTYADIDESGTVTLSEQQPCEDLTLRGCRVFLAPDKGRGVDEVNELSHDPSDQIDVSLRKGEQVLVFQYRQKFYAMDNKCPHSSYPLSNGIPFDIEDFGLVLSAGITCPKHGWQFDINTGTADRGSYKLKLWEVELRPIAHAEGKIRQNEVWVRKKQRIG